jgi:4-phospho-D-threonate 3-dehydrogenase / 4-phospho-D-erythronate 3-dehydrogenase
MRRVSQQERNSSERTAMNTLIRNRPRPSKALPIIAVTMGDAAGVGPELCLQLLARPDVFGNSVPLIVGDGDLLARVAKMVGVPVDAVQIDAPPKQLERPAVYDPPGTLAGDAVVPGKNQLICGRAAARYIREAVNGCVKGHFAALVTAPISKKALNLSGIDYPGHTEMLADLTGSKKYAMLLYSHEIACAFVTCHQSLRSVPDALSMEKIVDVAVLAWGHVTALRKKAPRLCLLGLNPHAGEEGLFGDEEDRIIIPAKKAIEARGIKIDGPLPPDTAFTPQARRKYGCYIAMYHDQGSIPFKMLAFETGVNITMGLPIVRTSPDHGTAFDIAWKGKVQPDSFLAAYEMAATLAAQQSADTRSNETRSSREPLEHGDKKITRRL